MAYTELSRLSSLAIISTDNLPFVLPLCSVALGRHRDVTVPLNMHTANLRSSKAFRQTELFCCAEMTLLAKVKAEIPTEA